MISDRERIEHMLQSISRIEDAMQDVSREDFFHSRLLLDAVSFNFAILGEAANKVSNEVQAKHGEIPWGDMIGMRNVLIHDYVQLRPEYMWDACKNDLEPLKRHLMEILISLPPLDPESRAALLEAEELKKPGVGKDLKTVDELREDLLSD